MITPGVRAHSSKDNRKHMEQFVWKIAEVLADPVEVDADATDMIINRLIDTSFCPIASLNRGNR